MKSYRGLPKEAKLFKDYCQDKKLVYTKELCQKALGDLALYGNQEYLLKKYGRLIMGCFNKADLQRFLKNQKNRGEQR